MNYEQMFLLCQAIRELGYSILAGCGLLGFLGLACSALLSYSIEKKHLQSEAKSE